MIHWPDRTDRPDRVGSPETMNFLKFSGRTGQVGPDRMGSARKVSFTEFIGLTGRVRPDRADSAKTMDFDASRAGPGR